MPVQKLRNGRWVIVGHEDEGNFPTRKHAMNVERSLGSKPLNKPASKPEDPEKKKGLISSLKEKLSGLDTQTTEPEPEPQLEAVEPEPEPVVEPAPEPEPEVVEPTPEPVAEPEIVAEEPEVIPADEAIEDDIDSLLDDALNG